MHDESPKPARVRDTDHAERHRPSAADLERFRPPWTHLPGTHPRCVFVPLGEPLGELVPGGLGDTCRPLGSD